MQRSLQRAGHECTVWGLNYDNYSVPFEEISKGHDVLLSLENDDTGWHPCVNSFEGVKAFWSIDSHCSLDMHLKHCRTSSYDLLLSSTQRYLDNYKNLVKYGVWFPNGYPSDFIKPNPEIETIQNQIIKGNFGHAYILSGSRGIGKTSTARLIAKALNCTNFNGDVCGVCENCLSIKEGGFVDVIEIDGASNRGIDDARSLRESLKFAPIRGKKKIYIIDEVHMLTTEAFNALLKALEEPPEYVVFILCTTEAHKIPETIKSRCQSFILKRPSSE